MQAVRFHAVLWRYPGPGGWTFAPVPAELAPPVTGAFGRTPVRVRLDGGPEWAGSVWQDRTHGTLLALPRKHRGGKEAGDEVEIELVLDPKRI